MLVLFFSLSGCQGMIGRTAGQFFTFFDDQPRALSSKRPSDACCGLAVIFSLALNVPTEIHSSTTASVREIGVLRIGVAPNTGLWADDLVAVLLASAACFAESRLCLCPSLAD